MAFDTNVAPPSPAALDLKLQPAPSPLEALAGLQEQRLRAQQIQVGQMQMQEAQLNLAQRKAINDAYRQAFTPQPDGSVQLDKDKLSSALATSGHGEAIPGILENYTKYQQSLAGLQETNQKVAAAEADAAGNLAATVKAANNDPTLFHALLTDAIQRKIIQPSHYAPLDQMLQQALASDPSGESARGLVGKFTDQMLAGSPKQQELTNARTSADAAASRAKSAAIDAQNNTARTNAELPGMEAESDLKAAAAAGLKNMTDADWQSAIDKTVPDKASPLYQRLNAEVDFYRKRGDLKAADEAIKNAGEQLGHTETAVATAKATQPIKIETAAATQQAAANAAEASGGLDLMAEQALNGSFTSRNPTLLAKVYGRASELARERGLSNQQVLMERNAARANATALQNLTKQYETLKPFEQMALKNAAVLEDKSKDVMNLGAPFLNTPIRDLQKKFLGNEKVAAFAAAMQPVQADFARILNSPTGGGVLSDDARHEMQQAISPGATPGQIKAALDVFRRDAQNRHETYDAAVKDLQGRTVVGNVGSKPSSAPTLPQGSGKVIDKATAQQFYEAAGRDSAKARQLAIQNGWKVQ